MYFKVNEVYFVIGNIMHRKQVARSNKSDYQYENISNKRPLV